MTTQEAIEVIKNGRHDFDVINEALEMAVLALEKQKQVEDCEPLTIDELKNLKRGWPVWTVGVSSTEDGNWGMWDIIENVDKDGVEFGYSTEAREWWNYDLREPGGELCGCAWACFRYPPKEEMEGIEKAN